MSTMSEQTRAKAKEKVARLNSAKTGVVDASGWKEYADEKGDVQTGPRPISRRQFKRGGHVAGLKAPMRADKSPRKAKGGGIVDDYFNVDMKKANDLRDGDKHDGGLKAGGRAGKAVGGPMRPMQRPVRTGASPTGIKPQIGIRPMKAGGKVHEDEAQDKKLIKAEMHKSGCTCAKCSGGRAGRASGGSTKNMSRKQRDAAKYLRPDAGFYEQLKGIRAAADPKNMGVTPRAYQRAQGVAEYLEKNQPKFIRLTADKDPERFQGEGIKRGGGIDKIEGLRDAGGREARASGGRAKKGAMNVNIIIAQKPDAPMIKPPMPAVGPPAGMPPGLHQNAPPPAAPAPMQPMMRKRGGRTYPLKSGGGGGLGRLEKIEAYG